MFTIAPLMYEIWEDVKGRADEMPFGSAVSGRIGTVARSFHGRNVHAMTRKDRCCMRVLSGKLIRSPRDAVTLHSLSSATNDEV